MCVARTAAERAPDLRHARRGHRRAADRERALPLLRPRAAARDVQRLRPRRRLPMPRLVLLLLLLRGCALPPLPLLLLPGASCLARRRPSHGVPWI